MYEKLGFLHPFEMGFVKHHTQEALRMIERFEGAVAEGRFELVQEIASKNAGQDADREEVSALGADPPSPVEAKAAARDDAVDVRMIGEGLGPGV